MNKREVKMLEFPQRGDKRGHLVIVEGMKDVPFDIKRIFYIYGSDKDVVRGQHANCVKTISLSQSAGQQLLSGCYPEFAEILEEIRTYSEDDLCLSAPGFDIRGIQHEKLYSRLYMS